MVEVAYPQELTQAWWDKKKPTLAKTKKTGIGEALKALKGLHDKIVWQSFHASNSPTAIDEKLILLPKEAPKLIDPCIKKAKEIEALAKKWAVDFGKEKSIPKAASEVATSIAKAAKAYIAEMDDFQGEMAKELVAQRKDFVDKARAAIKPLFAKTLTKIDGLIADIRTFANNPTEENFWSVFAGDSNARGYTTGCKNWDQFLSEYPELRDQCFKGKAMDVFFPGVADYGANYDRQKFDAQVNSKTGVTGSACYIWHAKHLIKELPNIRKFRDIVAQLLTLVK